MRQRLAALLLGLLALLIGLAGALDEGNPAWQRMAFVLGLAVLVFASVAVAIRSSRLSSGTTSRPPVEAPDAASAVEHRASGRMRVGGSQAQDPGKTACHDRLQKWSCAVDGDLRAPGLDVDAQQRKMGARHQLSRIVADSPASTRPPGSNYIPHSNGEGGRVISSGDSGGNS